MVESLFDERQGCRFGVREVGAVGLGQRGRVEFHGEHGVEVSDFVEERGMLGQVCAVSVEVVEEGLLVCGFCVSEAGGRHDGLRLSWSTGFWTGHRSISEG